MYIGLYLYGGVMKRFTLSIVFMSLCFFQESVLEASSLDLSSYLKEVMEHNKDLISSKQAIESSSRTAEASSLKFLV